MEDTRGAKRAAEDQRQSGPKRSKISYDFAAPVHAKVQQWTQLRKRSTDRSNSQPAEVSLAIQTTNPATVPAAHPGCAAPQVHRKEKPHLFRVAVALPRTWLACGPPGNVKYAALLGGESPCTSCLTHPPSHRPPVLACALPQIPVNLFNMQLPCCQLATQATTALQRTSWWSARATGAMSRTHSSCGTTMGAPGQAAALQGRREPRQEQLAWVRGLGMAGVRVAAGTAVAA